MKKTKTLSLLCLCAVIALASGCSKADPQIPAVISANIQSTETVVIDDADVNVKFTITLSQKLDKDVIVRVVPKGDVDAIDISVKDFLFQTGQGSGADYVSPETVKEGNITFKASAFPTLSTIATVELVLESDEIELSQDSKVTIVASRKQPAPPTPITAAISTANAEVTVDDADVPVDFTITLSEPLTNNATFNLVATSDSGVENGYELNTQSITIDAGQTTGTGSVTFKAAAFTCEHIVVEVAVTASTEAEVVMSTPTVTIKATKAVQ